jgi:hypothetical protein
MLLLVLPTFPVKYEVFLLLKMNVNDDNEDVILVLIAKIRTIRE